MRNPTTPEQLGSAIESLVASYVAEVRLSVQRAVERSLAPQVGLRPVSRGGRSSGAKSPMARRSQRDLNGVCEKLFKRVCARPGESMVTLAEDMGMPPSALQRPMAKLRADGRVRSVGKRHLMRYFPAVLREAAGRA